MSYYWEMYTVGGKTGSLVDSIDHNRRSIFLLCTTLCCFFALTIFFLELHDQGLCVQMQPVTAAYVLEQVNGMKDRKTIEHHLFLTHAVSTDVKLPALQSNQDHNSFLNCKTELDNILKKSSSSSKGCSNVTSDG